MSTRPESERLERPERRLGMHIASVGAITSALVVVTAGVLWAHDFWIVPNAFAVSGDGMIEVRGQTSTKFPTSLSAVTPERVADARVLGAMGEERITNLSVSEKSLVLRHKPSTPGQRVIAVALVPRASRTTPAGLKRYIALEGNAELAERYDREGIYPKADSITQHSAKYAKTIVEVGAAGPRAFARPAGHALEFVPANDPAALRRGDTLIVRLLFRGKPVAGAHLHAGAEAVQDGGADAKDMSVVTGADGSAKLPLDRVGLWNVRTLHAAPTVSGTTTEWDVAFATLVFNVSAPGVRNDRAVESRGELALGTPVQRSGSATDSADVAAVVARYHTALASGDSTAALALLAPDAVVLESGGVETREEYRSHHLPGDIEFARAIKSERGPVRVVVRGDVAWATGTSTTQGEYRGRQINSAGTELMVLSREPDGWKIRAIHWSSRTRR